MHTLKKIVFAKYQPLYPTLTKLVTTTVNKVGKLNKLPTIINITYQS